MSDSGSAAVRQPLFDHCRNLKRVPRQRAQFTNQMIRIRDMGRTILHNGSQSDGIIGEHSQRFCQGGFWI